MTRITPDKLLQYGAVCFIPISQADAVQGSMTYQSQTIVLLERSDELPGFLGWFSPAGLADPSLLMSDPGLSSGGTDASAS